MMQSGFENHESDPTQVLKLATAPPYCSTGTNSFDAILAHS
jgi:hypothetical protein